MLLLLLVVVDAMLHSDRMNPGILMLLGNKSRTDPATTNHKIAISINVLIKFRLHRGTHTTTNDI